MKSVKKFLNERMNSVDSADGGGSGKKTPLDRLKCSSGDHQLSLDRAIGGSGADAANQHSTITGSGSGGGGGGGGGYVSLPNTPLPLSAPIAVGDPSPSPSLADSAQNTPLCTLDEDATTSPKLPSTAPVKQEQSPFTFPTVHQEQQQPQQSQQQQQPAQRKSRRKISLPWFRQSSVSSSHGVLSRQHTIDTPSSFRFFRQPSNSGFKLGNQEATWVVADYTASSGSNELSVSKGQQVEIIELPTASEPHFCLVRLNLQHDDAAVQEGLVPVAVLKPPPGSHKPASSSSSAVGASAQKANDNMQQDQGNRGGKADALSSSTKRRGFSGRKWLPPPLRKLSQSKVEKPPNDKSLIKKPSEKNLRTPQKHAEEQQQQLVESGGTATPVNLSSTPQYTSPQQTADFEPDEEAGLEMPPPMKPIQEPHLIANGPPAYTKDLKEPANLASTGKLDGNPLSEIEQIVRERTEQHESNSRVDGSSGVGVAGENANTNGHGRAHASDNNEENHTSAMDSKEAAQRKRQHVLNELVTTEESYVKDLNDIVNGYMAEVYNSSSDIPMPDDLKGGKIRLVFNNIKDIYDWHRESFVRALRNCQKTPADLGPLIKRSTPKFAMYYYYCSNKPLSEFIVSAHYDYFDCIRQKLGHRMDLRNLIIKPVQRITKYELLIKDLIKATEGAGLHKEVAILQEAYQQMKVVVNTVNDMMMILRSLQDFDGEITAQGNLLLQGPLNCVTEAGQKQRELQVFLFQQIIIFADIEKAKTQFTDPTFKYRSHIQLNHMQMKELGDCRFQIKSTDPNKPEVIMICQAASRERYAEWLGMLEQILEQQNELINILSNPIPSLMSITKNNK